MLFHLQMSFSTSNILALGGTGSPTRRVSFPGYLHANAMRISKPQIAPKMYLSGQKYITITWSYTTINMIIPFDSFKHFDWVMMLLSSKNGPKCPKMAFFTQTTQKVPFRTFFSPKITFLKLHSQNTYESTLKMWFRKNFLSKNLSSPPWKGGGKSSAAKMMMDQRLLKCRLTAISFTTKII